MVNRPEPSRIVNDPAQLWSACATTIQNHVAEAVWRSTFQDIRPAELTAEHLRISVPSSLAREKIQRRYLSLVEDVLSEITGTPLKLQIEVDAVVLDIRDLEPLEESLVYSTAEHVGDPRPEGTQTAGTNGTDTELQLDEPLHPGYTFERFVSGPSNSFAFAAAQQVAEQPGRIYNPLFIYGGVGLGKTHLLHGIAHFINQYYPTSLVRLVSTEKFLNRFIYALRTHQLPAFKDFFRRVDVLLMDDAQFLNGKEGLQEEFFHTFNSLYETQSLLVLTSDSPPDAIPNLEDRLRSRFKMGLITDVQPPNIETRLAILEQRLPNECRTFLSTKVLEFIAERVTSNIRELEGALTRVCAFATLNQQVISLATAQDLLRDIFTPQKQRVITPAHVLAACSTQYGISIEEIIGASRRRQFVNARHVAMYVTRELTDLSFPAIAAEFGDRDHTTVIHAVNKIQQQMSEKQEVYEQVTQLTSTLRSSQVSAA